MRTHGRVLLALLALLDVRTVAFGTRARRRGAPRGPVRFLTRSQPPKPRLGVMLEAIPSNRDDGKLDGTTPAGIAAALEVSFVQACVQLASGYVDCLKLFIGAAVGAYEQGFTIAALTLELSQCATQTAGRPLMAEEVDLRTVWISLVYLTLENVAHPIKSGSANAGASVPEDTRQKFRTFVYDVVNAKAAGYTFEALKLEDVVRRSGEGEAPMSDMERAILSQSMRIVFLTLTVLNDMEAASGPPKPNIPGV